MLNRGINSSRISKISFISSQGYNLPIQIFGVRSECCAEGAFEIDASCIRTFASSGYPPSLLSGRYLCASKIQGRNANLQSNGFTATDQIGVLINYEKSDLEPKNTQGFLGFTFNTKSMKISVPQVKFVM